MQPEYGTSVRFAIEEDLGTRVALDDEFHFARIRLHTGQSVTASFNQRQFSKLKDEHGEIRAAAVGPVFAAAPTAYNTSDNIAFAEKADQKAVADAMDGYTKALLEYTQGRTAVKPDFPDMNKLPHWKDDFKLRETGSPAGGVMHLHLDPRDLRLSHAPNPTASHPWKRQSEYAQQASIFRDISREFDEGMAVYEGLAGRRAMTGEKAGVLFTAAAITVCKRAVSAFKELKTDFKAASLAPSAPKPSGKRKDFAPG